MRRLFLSILAVFAAWALPVTATGGAFGFSAQAQSADWQPDPEEQWLFDLRTDRFSLGQGIRGYARGSAICVDLGDMVRALDLPIRVNRELRRATGWAFDERRTLLIDREAGRVEVGSAAQPLRPGDIIDTPEGWCVAADRLAGWLGVSFAVDLSNSIIRISSETPLPFELAAERRARASRAQPQAFNLADLPQRSRPYALIAAPSVDVIATAEFRRDGAGASEGRARYEVFASGELLGASVNARLASDDNAVPTSLRVSAYRADPTGSMLGPLRATQIAGGDITGIMTPIGLESGIGRGALVTNQPLDRPAAFDRTQFRGDMPAGWEAELYRNGQLLAFASANASGRYEFLDVELIYGMNQFEIVLYGPQGQVRRDIRSIPVGMDSIPSGQTHYWAGVLEEGIDLLPLGDPTGDPLRRGWRAVLAIERGLDPKTGISLFATTRRYDRRRYSAVEAALRRALGTTLLEAAGSWQSGGGWAARLFWTGAVGRSSFQAESLILRNDYVSDRLPPGVTGAHSVSWQMPVRIANVVLPTQWDGRLRQFADGSRRWEGAARVSASFNRVSLTTRVQWAQVQRQDFADPPPDLTVGLLASVRLGQVRLRGDARLGLSGQAQTGFSLAADWRSGESSDWRAEIGYDRRSRIGRAGLSYTRRFDQFSLTGQGLASTDGAVTASLTLSMGIGPDPANGGIRFSRQRLAAEGQVMAEVFRDDNGDGLRQADELLVPNVVLTAGNAVAEQPTNAVGRAMIDALPPHRSILIGIDESSLDDPLTRAALPGIVIVPRPGVATRIQLPLVATGEVEGSLLDANGLAREGVDLELVDRHGAVRATTRSDFDGFFLFETVPYGEYVVQVAPSAAATLNVTGLLANLSLNRHTPRIRLGERRLVPADREAAVDRMAANRSEGDANRPPGRR